MQAAVLRGLSMGHIFIGKIFIFCGFADGPAEAENR
jgi:hypothetical protein